MMSEGPIEGSLRIWWNKNLSGKISRGKLAAHAAHAALAAYGIEYDHPIVVLGAGLAKIEAMPIVIRDAGVTELEPGTVTMGVEAPMWAGPIVELRELRAAREAVLAIHQGEPCEPECCDAVRCVSCFEDYPCPTVRAIRGEQ